MREADSSDPEIGSAVGASLSVEGGRAAWRAPKLTRTPVSRTLLGGTVGNEGNGVFAFSESGPPP